MGIEENKAAARRLVEEFLNNRNADIVDELTTEDFVDHQGGLGATGDRESLKQFVGAFIAAFPDLHFEIEHLIAEGDSVFLHVVARGTHAGEFRGIPATGKPVTLVAMSVARVENGRMAERWNVTDLAGLMQQLSG